MTFGAFLRQERAMAKIENFLGEGFANSPDPEGRDVKANPKMFFLSWRAPRQAGDFDPETEAHAGNSICQIG